METRPLMLVEATGEDGLTFSTLPLQHVAAMCFFGLATK